MHVIFEQLKMGHQTVLAVLSLLSLTLSLKLLDHETYLTKYKKPLKAITAEENEGMCSCFKTDYYGNFSPLLDTTLEKLQEPKWGAKKCTDIYLKFKEKYFDKKKYPKFGKRSVRCWDSAYIKRRIMQFELEFIRCKDCDLRPSWQKITPAISSFPPSQQEYALAVIDFVNKQEQCEGSESTCVNNDNYAVEWKEFYDNKATIYCGLDDGHGRQWCGTA